MTKIFIMCMFFVSACLSQEKNVSNENSLVDKTPAALKMQLEKAYPNLSKRLKLALQEAVVEQNSSSDVVYMFASNSVPISSMRSFIIEGSILNHFFGTKVHIYTQGFYEKDFLKKLTEIKKELSKYQESKLFLKNFYVGIAPQIFKDLNITQVPVLGYAKHAGKYYPSDSDMRYISRGDRPLSHLLSLMKEEKKEYEDYYNSIVDYLPY